MRFTFYVVYTITMDALSVEQKQAYDAVIKGESIFLTGPGGTGK